MESVGGGHVGNLGEGELAGGNGVGELGFEERFGLGEGAQNSIHVMI